MNGSGDLYAAMEAYFEVCKAALADTPAGAPPCAYISEGPAVWDSECLIVYAGGPAVADTFPLQPSLSPAHRFTYGQVNLVSISAVILRCATTMDEYGALPQPDAHAKVALQTSSDLWAIWNHVRQAKKDGVLFPPEQAEMFMDASTVQPQEGGLTGWQMTVRGTLGGYDPDP